MDAVRQLLISFEDKPGSSITKMAGITARKAIDRRSGPVGLATHSAPGMASASSRAFRTRNGALEVGCELPPQQPQPLARLSARTRMNEKTITRATAAAPASWLMVAEPNSRPAAVTASAVATAGARSVSSDRGTGTRVPTAASWNSVGWRNFHHDDSTKAMASTERQVYTSTVS